MKIILTGATGFLGGQLLTELDSSFNRIFGVSRTETQTTIACDLSVKHQTQALLDDLKPDFIVHCAAYVPKKLSDYNDNLLAKSNVLMTQNILDSSNCPIIYISSMTVYGNNLDRPVSENEMCYPENDYAKSKFDCESLIKKSGRPGYAIRIPGLFGMPRKSGLVYSLVYSALTGKDITLPQVPISWAGIHVVDAAKRIANLIPNIQENFSEINIGCKGKTSINQLIYLVNDIFGSNIETSVRHPEFEFDLSRYKDFISIPVATLEQSIEKFRNEINI